MPAPRARPRPRPRRPRSAEAPTSRTSISPRRSSPTLLPPRRPPKRPRRPSRPKRRPPRTKRSDGGAVTAPAFIGLSGAIASGKSEALAALGRLGAATLSTDAVTHELLDEPTTL